MRRPVARLAATVCGIATVLSCADPVSPANTPYGLRVWTEVVPETMQLRDLTGKILVRILINNPASRALIFRRLPDGVTITTQYEMMCPNSHFVCAPGNMWEAFGDDTLPPLQTFAEADTLRVIDLLLRWHMKVGTYRVRSWYRGQEGASANLVLVP